MFDKCSFVKKKKKGKDWADLRRSVEMRRPRKEAQLLELFN